MIRRTFCLLIGLLALVAHASEAERTSKGPKPRRIAHGAEVKLTDYLVPGKTTVFDFTSEYCPPCRAIAPMLEKVHATRAEVAVVAVDINRAGVRGIDWESPVVKQYGLNSVPHFKVFGPDGKLIAEDKPDDPKARAIVMKWFN